MFEKAWAEIDFYECILDEITQGIQKCFFFVDGRTFSSRDVIQRPDFYPVRRHVSKNPENASVSPRVN